LLNSINKATFYTSKIDNDVCKKAFDLVTNHQEKFTEQPWSCDVRTSNNITNNILNVPDFHDLKMHALTHVYNYMYLKKMFTDGYIKNSWVNIYEKNSYQEFHIHTDPTHKYISAVIYLTEDNSEIEFDVRKRIKVKPEFSNIIIFPDDLEHRALENKNDKLRISLAFNFICCEVWDIVYL
jgi:hypothetical protein